MIKVGIRRLLSGVAAVAAVGAFAVASSASAHADTTTASPTTITATTTCTNGFTGAQAGPSSFEVAIPETVVVGDTVGVTVTFPFTNNSGYDLSDANSITQAIATTGTAANPVTVTAGSQGAVPNGTTVTVTESGTWTADEVGTATFTLGDFSFDIVAFGFTIPVSCTFDSTPAAVSTVVTSPTTITATTTCTDALTGAQAGPSSFEVAIPDAAVVGDTDDVTVTFPFTNDFGSDLSDANSFTQAIATTGTAENPVTVTAGSQGAITDGTTVTVTESGTWTADEVGTATFTLGDFSFDIVASGTTIPVSCTFDSTPPAVSTVVTSS